MATTHDHLVTGDLGLTSDDDSILDLSQRTPSVVVIDDWKNHSSVPVDSIAEDEWKRRSSMVTNEVPPYAHNDPSMSDNVTTHRSTIDAYCATRKKSTRSTSLGVLHQLKPCLHPSPSDASTFLWSKYLAVIGERAVSDEFFDHYLASIESTLEIDMKLEYCYDMRRELYWLTQIQLVSHSLILLHYVGLPDDDTSHDFWACLYGQRCHPIGWCKEHRKLLLPPPIVTKQENVEVKLSLQTTPPVYLFDQTIGLTPAEQLHVGMIFELQDLHRPWTLWFVRIVSNHGGRLHLRYVTSLTTCPTSPDIRLFYLDYRLHPIGWISSIYSYDPPVGLPLSDEKQTIIEHCLSRAKEQFLPANVFKEQEEIGTHRFAEGMKLEVFEANSQQIYVGRIGRVYNEFYFDVHLEEERASEVSFVGHSTHPHLLPPRWAAEHRLALMKGHGLRQPEDYWAKHGIGDLASERCFHLITLNAAGSDRAEPGMKMELICVVEGEERVFSVTLIHVADHLMWLRIDNPSRLTDERDFFHVLPINSLDVFPVGWARHHGLELILPMDYPVEVTTHRVNRDELFSSVTHCPRIPRIYLSDVDLLTLCVNIRCFSGPHFCSSRLARLPSKFGPGPCRAVLLEMFHHLLSASSPTAHRALRRLAHRSHMSTEFVKVVKKSPTLLRPISIPTDSRLVHRYLRHVCTQLEACANLISLSKHLVDQRCPDRCQRLTRTFTFGSEKKAKRPGVTQHRQRREKARPPLETRNPVSWNVDEVCWYLNQSGCSFALKIIEEQEIDGAALLLLDDLNTVQDLLEFKLGPAVKFFHVVDELRRQVIARLPSSS